MSAISNRPNESEQLVFYKKELKKEKRLIEDVNTCSKVTFCTGILLVSSSLYFLLEEAIKNQSGNYDFPITKITVLYTSGCTLILIAKIFECIAKSSISQKE